MEFGLSLLLEIGQLIPQHGPRARSYDKAEKKSTNVTFYHLNE